MAYKTGSQSAQSHSSSPTRRPWIAEEEADKHKENRAGDARVAKTVAKTTTMATTSTTTTTKDATSDTKKDAPRTPARKATSSDVRVNPVSLEVHGVDAGKGRGKEATNLPAAGKVTPKEAPTHNVTESETGETAAGGFRTTDEVKKSTLSAYTQEPLVGPNAKRHKSSSETSDLDASGEDGGYGDVSGNDDESSSGRPMVDMVPKESVNESRHNEAPQDDGLGAMVMDTTDDEGRLDSSHHTPNGSGVGSVTTESSSSLYGKLPFPATKAFTKLLRTNNADISNYLKTEGPTKNPAQMPNQRLTTPQRRQLTIAPSRKSLGAKLPQPTGNANVSNQEMETEVGTLKKRKQPSFSGAGNEKDPLVFSDSADSSDEEAKNGGRAKMPGTTAIKEDCSSTDDDACVNKATQQQPKATLLKLPRKTSEDVVDGKEKKAVADKKLQRELEIGERVYAEFSGNKVRRKWSVALLETVKTESQFLFSGMISNTTGGTLNQNTGGNMPAPTSTL